MSTLTTKASISESNLRAKCSLPQYSISTVSESSEPWRSISLEYSSGWNTTLYYKEYRSQLAQLWHRIYTYRNVSFHSFYWFTSSEEIEGWLAFTYLVKKGRQVALTIRKVIIDFVPLAFKATMLVLNQIITFRIWPTWPCLCFSLLWKVCISSLIWAFLHKRILSGKDVI